MAMPLITEIQKPSPCNACQHCCGHRDQSGPCPPERNRLPLDARCHLKSRNSNHGESLPVDKVSANEVFARHLNQPDAALEIRVTAPRLPKHAWRRSSRPVEEPSFPCSEPKPFHVESLRGADTRRLSLPLAVALRWTPSFLGFTPPQASTKALCLLVSPCPCALVIATPVTW